MPLELRSATREDIEAFKGEPGVGPTVKAIVAYQDGKPIALGGLGFIHGRVCVFCDLHDEARRYKKLMHKTALRVLSEAKAAGHRLLYAEVDANELTATRWLARLGFEPLHGDERVWVWRQ